MHAFRSHTCADLTKENVGQTIRLSGWVHRVRDHGGVLFIDLRKAFDTVNHNVLLHKLASFGVPQGSILGPLFFIYI